MRQEIFVETGESPNSRKLEGGVGRRGESVLHRPAGKEIVKLKPQCVITSSSLRRSCCSNARAQNQGTERKDEINKNLKMQRVAGHPGSPCCSFYKNKSY